MKTEELKNAENITRDLVLKNQPIYATESALAVAKDIQGLRAIFEEVTQLDLFTFYGLGCFLGRVFHRHSYLF